jgi:cytochrome c6
MKTNIIIAAFSLFFINMRFTQSNQLDTGREVYEKNCAKCHGKDGSKKSFGVKSLQKSQLSSTETLEIITNGNGKMPNWKEKLSIQEIEQVSEYIDTFRKK